MNLVCKILDEEIRDNYVDPTDTKLGTFNDYDMKNLVFLNVNRLMRHLVRFRAICNRVTAISYVYIKDEDLTQLLLEDKWSLSYPKDKSTIDTWLEGIE